MVIWSILTQQAWDDLQRRGRLRAARRHVMQEFLGPYAWMAIDIPIRIPPVSGRGCERQSP